MRALLMLLLAVGSSLAQEVGQDQPAPQSGCLTIAVSAPALAGADCGDASGATLRGPTSAVFAPAYVQRIRIQQQEFQTRFGLHSVGELQIGHLSADTTTAAPLADGRGPFLQSAGDRTFAGLLWERENLLFDGDRLRVRSASEMQWLARQSGLVESSEQAELLSVLGWRSRLRLEWQLGQPERRFQWQVAAQVDRHSDQASASIQLQAIRRF